MKQKSFKRVTSWVLTLAMLFSLVPSSFAVDDEPIVDTPEDAIVSELPAENQPADNTPDVEEPASDEQEEDTIDGVIPPEDTSADSESDFAPYAGVTSISSAATYYVANSAAGGSDINGNGTDAAPYMTIKKALAAAQSDADEINIVLKSDIESTLELSFDSSKTINFTSDGGNNYKIQFSGTTPIGTESGFIKVIDGATVNFDGVDLFGSTGTYDGRVIYVANNGIVNLTNLTVSRGRVNNVTNNQGGAGAMAADRGTLNVGEGVVFTGNSTIAGGGAIFVANGGHVTISDNAEITDNSAKYGAGIYADTQTESYGGLEISDEVSIKGNKAAQQGSGMFICKSANATVVGDVVINENKTSGAQNNVYLEDEATLDIAGTTTGANIGISADPEEAYRLVSLPAGHTIAPTKNGDEKGWHDDCGKWDIRHMTYKGVEGLYLYYKTLDVTFEDVRTLTKVEGKDINGEDVDFKNDHLSSVSVSNGVLTAADTVAKNTPEDDDLTYTITVDKDEYRIPTEDVVHVTSGGNDVEFTYTPDFSNGTATITIDDAIVDTLTDTIKFEVSGEKYYTLTIRSEGPLYTMNSSITRLSEDKLVVAGTVRQGNTATYKIAKGSGSGPAAAGVQISLYDTVDYAGVPVATVSTDETGTARFTGLQEGKTYYAVLTYERQYRVISRDVTSLKLSTLQGQSLAAACATDGGADGRVTYDASTGDSTVTGITEDALVTYSIKQVADTIIFHANEGEATSKPAVLSMENKTMGADADTYGELATATLTGYTFDGWYTEAEGGDLVTKDTPYVTGVSARNLYAHWTANTNTNYKIRHWVEYAEGGANNGYTATTATKLDNGVKYYLYVETPWDDGTSDAIKDITDKDLKSMASATLTWWNRDGFTARADSDCKVLANGNAIFNIYYDRNIYKLNFDASGEGTATSPDTFPAQDVKFGALVGELPAPRMPGYSFGGWYDDNNQLFTSTTIYNKNADTDLTGHWIARDDTNWAIKIAVQDIVRDPDTGVYSAADTYTEYKTVYKDNNGALLSYKLTGTTDTAHQFAISSISALTFEGFDYVGYADALDAHAANMTADTANATVTIKPTDASTEIAGEDKYNDAFDGGIVWLYYNRKTADVKPNPTEPGGDTDGGKIIYGGDFTGQLPPDPSKPGYDFNGWKDKDGDDITPTTPADKYVEADNTITVTPKWEARDYTLTYVPGEGASFVASDGGAGTVNNNVPGGYQDSHTVTYDQAMGTMPTASKPGYNFVGWFLEDGTEVTSSTVVTIDNVIVKNPANTYEETRPLHAKFTPHHYTLVFNPGSDKQGNPGSVTPAKMVITYDEILSDLPTPALTGYTFVSWMLNLRDPNSVFKNGDRWTTVLTDGAEIPVYATYVANTYKYTFDLNDEVGSTRASLIDTSIDHTEETYDKVYDGLFDVEATRPGYDFKGWSLVKNGDVLTADDMVRLAQDTTVYAKWQPKEYNVKFVMKGSTMPDTFDQTTGTYDAAADTWTVKVKFDSVYGTLPVPTKTDAKYHGWLAAAANWDEIDNEILLELPQYIDYKDEDGITLTAVMEPWITFDPNGNKFADDDSTDPRKELQSEIDKLPEVKKDGYTFDGWVKEDNPDKVLSIEDVKKLEEPTVLKPKFSANITFNANGGVVSANNAETYVVGISKITTLPSASKSGYVFNGWFTAVSGGTQVTYDGLKTANVPATVYAQYTVRSSGGGGGGGGGGGTPTNTITVKKDDGATVTPGGDKDGKVSVPSGSDKNFTIKADDGYTITDVIVDGKSQGPKDSYKFTNVRENHTLEVKVAKMLTGDHIAYIKGYPDGGVHPEANITRAEVSAIFYRLLTDSARDQYAASSSRFADANNSWAAKEIATLTNAGILKGYNDGTFRPNASITRAEFAAIASRFDKLSGGTKTFSDVPSSHWAYAAITSAAEKGWVNGYSDGTFRPENAITRAEVVKITNAVLNRICDKNYVAKNLSKLTSYNDLSASHWAYYDILEASNAHDYKTVSGVENWTAQK